MTTKKRLYEKPTMKVVKMKETVQLLDMSHPDYEPTEW